VVYQSLQIKGSTMKADIVKQVKINDVANVIQALLNNDVKKVTRFISPNVTVTATRLHRPDKRSRGESYVVTVGRPNYANREFIKECKAAGEPFPVRNMIFQHFPAVKRG
jgi:hypothetical protein